MSKKIRIVNYNQVVTRLNESNFFYINSEGYVMGVCVLSYDRNGVKESQIKQIEIGGQYPNVLAVEDERLYVGTLEGQILCYNTISKTLEK